MENSAVITKPNAKPNCYQCIHRRPTPGDAHSQCVHPSIRNPVVALTEIALGLNLVMDTIDNRILITWNEHGSRNGWFMWPVNFDPVWLESCTGYEPFQPL